MSSPAYQRNSRVALVGAGLPAGFEPGMQGVVVSPIEQADGYWYQVRLGRGWHCFKETNLIPARQAPKNEEEPMTITREPDGWELYVPARQIEVKLLGNGKMVLSEAAHGALGDGVQVLWHAGKRAIGIRPGKGENDAVLPVTRAGKGARFPTVDIDPFLARYGLLPKEVSGSYKAVEENGLFVIVLKPA
jgi:hypothetical protein